MTMKKGMKDMKKMVIAEIQAAKEELLDILSGKQNADGQKIDAHITAAAKALDEARIKLEQERDADSEKAGDAGHQIRVRTLIEFLKGDHLAVMKPDDIEALFRPVSFDPSLEIMLRSMLGWNARYKEAFIQIAEIFGDVQARSNAISVLKSQAQRVRGLCAPMDEAENVNGHTAAASFDAVLDALENWNEDMTRYGG